MQQRQEALHPINARSLRAETYRDILVASPPSAELREACPVEPECRAARGGHAAGEIVRHVTDAATIRISAAAGLIAAGRAGQAGRARTVSATSQSSAWSSRKSSGKHCEP